MGSILLAAVPSKSSKNISRIPNPFPLPRHAMSTLTPSKCSPIYQKEEKKIKEMGENLFPFFFGGGFSARLSKQWVRDHSRAGYRWRQSKCGVKARCVCDLMHPRFIQKIAWCWWRGGDRTEKLDSGETCSKSVRLDLPAREGKRDAFFSFCCCASSTPYYFSANPMTFPLICH